MLALHDLLAFALLCVDLLFLLVPATIGILVTARDRDEWGDPPL